MLRDLINTPQKDIEFSAQSSVENTNFKVMYLHNNGSDAQELQVEDFTKWVEEDIDE